MKISIFGLGYVGCVSLGCLAQNGHDVIGVDIQEEKVDLINKGLATIVENEIDKIISTQQQNGKIRATLNYIEAIKETDISFLCVGTPSSINGELNLEYIYRIAEQIGEALKEKDRFHTIVIRSTVLPGTNQKVGAIIENASGKSRNANFSVVSNPEFLREGSAVKDYYHPAVTVIGSDNEYALNLIKEVYQDIDAPIEVTDITVAEIIKYVNNSYHALKISFANEIGNICKQLGIDSYKVMELFCKDTHLNISPVYFKPGFSYGGSCLPKDLRGLVTIGHNNYIKTPILSAIELSNENQKEMAYQLIAKYDKKRIAFLGLSFKEGTDDLRYSPYVDLAEKLIGKGYQLNIYDKNVQLSKLVGMNKAFIQLHLPHLSELIIDNVEDAIKLSELVLVNHKGIINEKNRQLLNTKVVIDLVKLPDIKNIKAYEGLCW